MLKKRRSITTVGIYLRNLRSLFNDYIDDENAPRRIYPFGRKKYVIPTGKNVKKALKIEDIGKIYNYDVEEGSETSFAKDMFLLSYFCNGMNIGDIFRLKYKDIKGDRIYFYRKKSIRTAKANLKIVDVIITDEIVRILDRWKNLDDDSENYILPVLNDIVDLEIQRKRIKNKTNTINKHLKIIFKNIGFEVSGSSGYARHSYATIIKNSGASIEFISECVGHTSIQATKNYLDSFEDDIKKEYAKKLTAFKKTKDE